MPLSVGTLGLGLVLLATSVWRATHVQVSAATQQTALGIAVMSVPQLAAASGLDRLLIALEKDPFHPLRHRPGRRFQLPSEPATPLARRSDDQPASSLRLIGTAVTGDGGSGFAMCAWQGGTPRIVRVGEQVSGWTLVKVTPGAADFATPGGRVTVRVPKAGT